MKKILIALFTFAALSIHAASPAYEQFNAGDFSRSGNNLKLVTVPTNNISGSAAFVPLNIVTLVKSNGSSINYSNNILLAASNAIWGDVIKPSAGRFYLGSNSLPMNPGVSLSGAGKSTRIIGYGYGPAILLGNSNVIEHVYVDYDPALLQALMLETDDSIIFQPFGVPSVSAAAFSGKLGYSSRLVTNCIIQNVTAHGQSDILFFNTNTVHLTVRDSVFFPDWDFYYDETLAGKTNTIRFENVAVYWLTPTLTNAGGDFFSTQNAIVNGTGNSSNEMTFINCSFKSTTTSVLRISSAGNTNTSFFNCVVDMPIISGGSAHAFDPDVIKAGSMWVNGSNYIFGSRTFINGSTFTGGSTNKTAKMIADYSVQTEGFFFTNTSGRRAEVTLALSASYDLLPGWLGFQVCVVEPSNTTNYFFSSSFLDTDTASADITLSAVFPLNPSARFYWQRADASVPDATYVAKVKSSPPNAGFVGSHIVYE